MEKERPSTNSNNILQKIRDPDIPLKKFTILKLGLVAILVGIGLILISPNDETTQNNDLAVNTASLNAIDAIQTSSNQKSSKSIHSFEEQFENQLKGLLEQMTGITEVSVMVNLDATPTKVYEKNVNTQVQQTTEKDKQGGTRSIDQQNTNEQVVILRNGSEEKPVLQKEQKPSVRGVFIVAKGADKIEVKKNIIEAVTRALDVPSHRVSVQAKK